jgi:GT2 family glycosyltransferase
MSVPNKPEFALKFPVDCVPGKIGVVTVTYNSSAVLPDFLGSIEQQSYRHFILIAVDNASVDDTLEQLRASNFSNLVLIENEQNRGVAAGNNQGIRAALAAGCEHVLLINNDVTFGPDLLAMLLSGLAKQSCDMTTPLIYFNDPPTRIWAAGGEFQPLFGWRIYHKGENETDDGRYDRPQVVRYTPTCCVLIRGVVFRQIGLMDERYFVYFDDVDFMYRASLACISLFLIPEAKLRHKVNSLTGGEHSDFSLFYGTRGRTLFLCKHFGRLRGTFWTWSYWVFYWLKPLLGKATWHQSAVWRKGIRAGRRVGLEQFEELRI